MKKLMTILFSLFLGLNSNMFSSQRLDPVIAKLKVRSNSLATKPSAVAAVAKPSAVAAENKTQPVSISDPHSKVERYQVKEVAEPSRIEALGVKPLEEEMVELCPVTHAAKPSAIKPSVKPPKNLYQIVASGDVMQVEKFLEQNPYTDLRDPDSKGQTPLIEAAKQGNLLMVATLLNAQTKRNKNFVKDMLNDRDNQNLTALMHVRALRLNNKIDRDESFIDYLEHNFEKDGSIELEPTEECSCCVIA